MFTHLTSDRRIRLYALKDNDIGEEKTSGPASQEKSPKVSKKKAKKDN